MSILLDFIYLFKNRERPRNAKRFLILLAKRIVTAPRLAFILYRKVLFCVKGAHIGRLVVLGHSNIGGDPRNLFVGDESSLGRCDISLHATVTIGRRVVINDGVIILTASHSMSDPDWRHTFASVVIEDYAWIATSAIILPGSRIGTGAVVGAGAVVRGVVPEYAVVSGNPFKVHTRRRVKDLSYSPVVMNAPFEAWLGRQKTIE